MASSKSYSTARNAKDEAINTVKSSGKSFGNFIKKFFNDWSLHLTQALTFVLVTSVIPLGMLLVAIVGQIIGTMSPHARGTFLNQINHIPLLPSSGAITQSAFDRLSVNAGIWIILSIIVALFLGSRLFTLLEASFDIIYRVPQRAFKQKNIRAILMVIVFMILTPLLVLTSLIPEQFIGILRQTSVVQQNTGSLNHIVGIISSLIVSFLLFEIIYVFVPNRNGRVSQRIKDCLPGAIFAAVALQIGLLLFPIYSKFVTNGVVGQIAFVLIFLISFYLIALITIIGASVNAYYSENIPAPSKDLITRVSHTS